MCPFFFVGKNAFMIQLSDRDKSLEHACRKPRGHVFRCSRTCRIRSCKGLFHTFVRPVSINVERPFCSSWFFFAENTALKLSRVSRE